jgi:Ni/Fe-hydrogenase 1 B-type cytochrome subunit
MKKPGCGAALYAAEIIGTCSYLRNPLARMSYVLLYVLVAIELLDGIRDVQYDGTDQYRWGLFWLGECTGGGEFMTHLMHHYVAWFIILFAIGHLYMVTRAEFMEGESEVSRVCSRAARSWCMSR